MLVPRLDLFDELDAAAVLQREVDDDEIGTGFRELGEGVGDAVRLGTDLEVGLLIDQECQPLPDDGMIINDHDPLLHDVHPLCS